MSHIPFALSEAGELERDGGDFGGYGARAVDSINNSGSASDLAKSGAMVVAIDPFMSEEFNERATPMPAGWQGSRTGLLCRFANGYERTVLANRAA